MKGHFAIRKAAVGDAAALLDIYAPYIQDTAVTFEYTVPPAAEFAGRIAETAADYPYLVLERDGVPQGYAYAHRLRERAAFDWDAELSVYLSPAVQGQGAGGVLYRCLIDLLERQGVRRLYGCVTLPNAASERLHTALGFVPAGVWHRSGWKHGRWHDVGWFEKMLGGAQAPQPIVPFGALPPREIEECLQTYTEMINMEE